MKLSGLCRSLLAFFLVFCLSSLALGLEPARSGQVQDGVIQAEALATGAGKSRGVLVFGIEADGIAVLQALASRSDATLGAFKRGEGAFVSTRLSQQLAINPGDLITLVDPTGESTPMGPTPSISRYRVLGLVDSPLFTAAGEGVYIRKTDAEKFSGT